MGINFSLALKNEISLKQLINKKMKKNHKLILICIVIAFWSCEKEVDLKINTETKTVFGKVNLDQIPKIKKAIEKKIERKIERKKMKRENASNYLTKINPENIITIIDSIGHKSYTFSLNLHESDKMTNLVIQETSSGLSYHIITYSSTEIDQWKIDIQNKFIKTIIKPNISFQDLDAPSTLTSRTTCQEVTTTWTCPYGIHDISNYLLCTEKDLSEWTFETTFENYDCGGSTSGTTSPNTSGGVGGGGNTSQTPTDPCQTLSNAKDNLKVSEAINFLKSKTTEKQEFAIEIERKVDDLSLDGFTYTTNQVKGGNFNTNTDVGGYINGVAHNHPINGIPIPSWNDIYWTQQCEENISTDNTGSAFNIVVVPDPIYSGETIIYAVTIDNIITLQQATSVEFNTPQILGIPDENKKAIAINDIFAEKFIPIKNNTPALEKKFLEVHASYGISLYKYDVQQNKWNKLKLQTPYDPNNPTATNSVIQEPCN